MNLKRTRRLLMAFLDNLNVEILKGIIAGDVDSVAALSVVRERSEMALFRLDDLIASEKAARKGLK